MIQGVMQWKLRQCWKMWVQGKIMPKCKLFESIPLHVQELNYGKNIYELEDHVGEVASNSNLSPKLGHAKKPSTSFPNCILKNTWIESTNSYA